MPNSTIRNSFFIFMGPNKTGKIACHGGCVDKNVVMLRGSISVTVGSAAFQAKKKGGNSTCRGFGAGKYLLCRHN